MSKQNLSALAAAVTDGDAVDWAAVRARLQAPDDSGIATHLQALSELQPTRTTAMPAPGRGEPLPWLIEGARLLAILVVGLGAWGELYVIVGWGRTEYLILFAVLAAFASTAVYLDLAAIDRRARALSACYWTV